MILPWHSTIIFIPGSRYPWRSVENFIKLFVPLLITSLALALAFKMRFWNIGTAP